MYGTRCLPYISFLKSNKTKNIHTQYKWLLTRRQHTRSSPHELLSPLNAISHDLRSKSNSLADVNLNPNVMDLVKTYIAHEVYKISTIEEARVYDAIKLSNNLDDGDLIIPIPQFREKSIPPQKLAAQLAEKFPRNSYIRKIESKGPFLRFFIDPKFLFASLIPDITSNHTNYGRRQLLSAQKVIVEFSSPNIAKPFHAGHLRSTIIGGFISNLYETMGWNVTRMNYLGDWGKQFGLLAVGYQRYGKDNLLKVDPINHLFDVYVRINRDMENESADIPYKESVNGKAKNFFKRMEDGDPDALKVWENFRSLSITKYIETYSRLNIKYDVYSGESQVPKDKMDRALELFKEKHLLEESNGATLIDLTKFNKKLGKTVIQKSDGTTLYLTRDVGAAMDRYDQYNFDKMIYVIASQQDLHTAQLFEILNQLGFDWAANLQHVNFGMVKGMSTRKGTVVFLDNILEEAKEKVLTIMQKDTAKYSMIEDPEKVADLIGVSAVMIQDMQSKRINNYKFEWSRMLSFEGDTGPYLQYAHSRLHSIADAHPNLNITNANLDLLQEPEAVILIRILAQYPDVLKAAMKTLEPCTITTYLFKVAHQVSSCYAALWVAGQPEDVAAARLALYNAARQILHNGMLILGLTPVNRM